MTIDSSVGTATITKQPQRVVAIGWGSQDAALALGVKPVGMQDMTGNTGNNTGILPWDKAKLGTSKPELINYVSDKVPYEQIAALHPDVILAVDSGLTKTEWSQLNHIAPTVGYPGVAWQTSWQDQIGIVGKALGRTSEAAALEKSTNALISKARADHPEFRGKTVAFGSGTATDSFNLYLASDSRVQLLKELGFTISSSMPKSGTSFAVPLSLERLDTIDSDVLVSWYLSSGVQKSLEGSPLFKRMPAVRRHGYVPITDPAMVFATSSVTVLSLPWMLDRYLPLLSKAADGKASS
ncbi:iron-siderophore ABC transporter substrate-binding protein [Flexivirga caeni]|uniref:iron-siderophore ABC transporter substrate-binding protein n=1 Tax=Flexivirga caeni TaxID=2294115 RepID=UPI001C6596F9|nr:iron-siderophore ABC transporter substrate-binding protein [Flexivirga caeni]